MKLKVNLQHIETKHFRCFDGVFVKLHPQLNVIIGINGAGKTALLEAIAGLLQPLVARIRSEGSAEAISGFGQKDIKNDSIEAINTIWAEVRIEDVEDGPYSQELSWFGTLNKEGYEVDNKDEQDFLILDNVIRVLNEKLLDRDVASLPVFVYYPCETADDSLARPNGADMDDTSFDIFTTYKNALNRRAFDYKEFARWFKWQELVARESGKEGLVKVVEAAILQVISDGQGNFQRLHTRYKNRPEGELVLSKNGLEVIVDQLSSGERMLFGLVGDLARRLVVANPGADEPLKGSGVVLIDEIDLHLHPRWQRLVLFKLRNIFPNVQFIVTTHSPQVLQYVKPEHIILLDNGQVVEDKIRTLGKDSDLILREAFSVNRYSEEIPEIHEVRAKVRRCFDLIDDEAFREAEKLLKELEELLGGNDPDIVELRTLFSLTAQGYA